MPLDFLVGDVLVDVHFSDGHFKRPDKPVGKTYYGASNRQSEKALPLLLVQPHRMGNGLDIGRRR